MSGAEDKTSTPVTNFPVQESLPFRDAKTENGQISADVAYDLYLDEYYPDYKSKVYRVPFTTIFRCTEDRRVKLAQDKLYMMGRPNQGEIAEKKVADSLEKMLQEIGRPAFIITNYKWKHFCNEKGKPPPGDENVANMGGEHDIVIISFHHGVYFIQVKGTESIAYHERQWIKAKNQCHRDKDFFKKNFKDLKLAVTTKMAISFPNLDTNKLKDEFMSMFEDHITKYQKDDLLEYLLDDHLSGNDKNENKEKNLRKWWENSTNQSRGFKSDDNYKSDDYKRVIARYIGRKSTVKLRSWGDVVAYIGNRYMNILLTPEQIAILNSGIRKLIIRGQYGSGKTTLLILKVRELLPLPVKIISMSKSPLKHVLEASVMDEMGTAVASKLDFVSVADSEQLKTELNMETKCHVFIDEMPSDLEENESLLEVIKTYPTEYWFWVVMSSEREENLSDNIKKIFNMTDNQDNPDANIFRVTKLNKVVRCPPSIFPRVAPRPTLRKIFKRTKANMNKFFELLGIVPQNSTSLSVPSVKYTWSDILVIDASFTKTTFHNMLLEAKLPIHYMRNMADVTMDVFEDSKKQANGMRKVLLTNRLPADYDLSENFAATVHGGKICWPTVENPIQKIDTQEELDKYFLSSGIDVDNWENMPKNKLTKITFVDEPEVYHFLKKLDIPLVTPCDIDKVLSKEHAVLYTDEQNLEGFLDSRKIVMRVIDENVVVNSEVQSTEGPYPVLIEHVSYCGDNPVETCEVCCLTLKDVFRDLGLIKPLISLTPPFSPHEKARPELPSPAYRSVDSEISSTQQKSTQSQQGKLEALERNIMSQHRKPRKKLHWSDVVVVDDRSEPRKDVVDLLQKLIKVEVKLEANLLDKEHAFGYDDKILYTTPENFKGLERKVVLVVIDKEDNSDLARSRCSSQLILFKIGSVEESTLQEEVEKTTASLERTVISSPVKDWDAYSVCESLAGRSCRRRTSCWL